MKQLSIYQVDAFTCQLFGGNPAAVVPLEQWLPDELMQQLAAENNLSETVFFVPHAGAAAHFAIRWFTPGTEVNLCGHATLAAAWVLFNHLNFEEPAIKFSSKSGLLTVTKQADGLLTMDFPSWMPSPIPVPEYLAAALQTNEIVGVHQHRDLLVVLPNEVAVRNCQPNFLLLKKHHHCVIITAAGEHCDFVSRFFASDYGIDEDPVTGSAHSQLIPYWSKVLQKEKLHALQLSARGGELWCRQLGTERVEISGHCVFYMQGSFVYAT
jgi:PhzF family phenazine biosynthesis protein